MEIPAEKRNSKIDITDLKIGYIETVEVKSNTLSHELHEMVYLKIRCN